MLILKQKTKKCRKKKKIKKMGKSIMKKMNLKSKKK